MEMVKDMKEGFLCLFFPGQELNIINDQHIHHHIEIHKILEAVIPDSINKLAGELFRRNV
ncbi:hypothetical protein D9M69_693660 [compost metagenome]